MNADVPIALLAIANECVHKALNYFDNCKHGEILELGADAKNAINFLGAAIQNKHG